MINLITINAAINDYLENKLSNTSLKGVPIVAYDISEGFERPCMKVELESGALDTLNSNYLNRSLTVRIYFFATDIKKYKVENLKAQYAIEMALIQGIPTEHGHIMIENIESTIVDTVLEITFEINLNFEHDFNSDKDLEYMEDLEINI